MLARSVFVALCLALSTTVQAVPITSTTMRPTAVIKARTETTLDPYQEWSMPGSDSDSSNEADNEPSQTSEAAPSAAAETTLEPYQPQPPSGGVADYEFAQECGGDCGAVTSVVQTSVTINPAPPVSTFAPPKPPAPVESTPAPTPTPPIDQNPETCDCEAPKVNANAMPEGYALYRLSPRSNSSLCLTVDTYTTEGHWLANDMPVKLAFCNETSPAQVWTMPDCDNTDLSMRLGGSSFCMDYGTIPEGQQLQDAIKMKVYKCASEITDPWTLPAQHLYYTWDQRLSFAGMGSCLDFPNENGFYQWGQQVQSWKCVDNNANQIWDKIPSSLVVG